MKSFIKTIFQVWLVGAVIVGASMIMYGPKDATAQMSPEEQKAQKFQNDLIIRGRILEEAIRKTALDEDSLKFRDPLYYKNGVCIQVNGKNRFGAYVGWQEHCTLVNNKGIWEYSGPG